MTDLERVLTAMRDKVIGPIPGPSAWIDRTSSNMPTARFMLDSTSIWIAPIALDIE